METNTEPAGYFITWTVYGTFLQGDRRWWRKTTKGSMAPQPKLERWHRDRLKHTIILLSREHRKIVETEIAGHCQRRGWTLWVANARSNHVHVVVTASGCAGATVRDQLKANCTRGLREMESCFHDRPVWTTKGDVEFLDTDEEVHEAVKYVRDAQDQMDRGK